METISEVFPLQSQQAHSWSPVQVCVQDRSQASVIIMSLLSSITSFESKGLRQMPQGGLVPRDLSWTLSCLNRLWNILGSADESLLSWSASEKCLVMFLEMLRVIVLQLVNTKHENVNMSRTSVLLCRTTATLLLLKPDKLADILEQSICLSLFEIARLSQRSTAISEAFDEDLLPILVDSQSRLMNFGTDLRVCLCGSLSQKPAEPFKAVHFPCHSPSYSKQ